MAQYGFDNDPFLLEPADVSSSDSTGGDGEVTEEVSRPTENDVLLGRGGGTYNHCGNIKFRKLVNEHKMRYLACSKVDKPKVAREVVRLWRMMEPPGRFLACRDGTKTGLRSVQVADSMWFEVCDKKARVKASQCLRERTPELKFFIRQLRDEQDVITEQGFAMVEQQMQMHRQDERRQQDLLIPQDYVNVAQYERQRQDLMRPHEYINHAPRMEMQAYSAHWPSSKQSHKSSFAGDHPMYSPPERPILTTSPHHAVFIDTASAMPRSCPAKVTQRQGSGNFYAPAQENEFYYHGGMGEREYQRERSMMQKCVQREQRKIRRLQRMVRRASQPHHHPQHPPATDGAPLDLVMRHHELDPIPFQHRHPLNALPAELLIQGVISDVTLDTRQLQEARGGLFRSESFQTRE
jgi:hypothetical protein